MKKIETRNFTNIYHEKIAAMQRKVLTCPEIRPNGKCYSDIPKDLIKIYPEFTAILPDYGMVPDFPRIVWLLLGPKGGEGDKGTAEWIKNRFGNPDAITFDSTIYSNYLESEDNYVGFLKFDLYTGEKRLGVYDDKYSLSALCDWCFGSIDKLLAKKGDEERRISLIRRTSYMNLVHCPGPVKDTQAPSDNQIKTCVTHYLRKILEILEPHFIFTFGVPTGKKIRDEQLRILDDCKKLEGQKDYDVYLVKLGKRKICLIENWHIFARGDKKEEITADYDWYIKEPRKIWENRQKLGLI